MRKILAGIVIGLCVLCAVGMVNAAIVDMDDVGGVGYFKDMNYLLSITQSAQPFMTDKESKIVGAITEAIREVTGLDTKYSTAGGTSDARFFAEFGVDVVEFGVRNDTIHAPNERTTPEEVTGLKRVFEQLITFF